LPEREAFVQAVEQPNKVAVPAHDLVGAAVAADFVVAVLKHEKTLFLCNCSDGDGFFSPRPSRRQTPNGSTQPRDISSRIASRRCAKSSCRCAESTCADVWSCVGLVGAPIVASPPAIARKRTRGGSGSLSGRGVCVRLSRELARCSHVRGNVGAIGLGQHGIEGVVVPSVHVRATPGVCLRVTKRRLAQRRLGTVCAGRVLLGRFLWHWRCWGRLAY
jgi:hypothetical protein